ncbi:hypothetical protein DO73_4341 [Burkholderia pseudomallei]|nr:hypothetical protein DO73_4341 [Burkholderia pseudomallei]
MPVLPGVSSEPADAAPPPPPRLPSAPAMPPAPPLPASAPCLRKSPSCACAAESDSTPATRMPAAAMR